MGAEVQLGELSENASGIIEALLHPDPAERLGGPLRSNEVRVHPFFWGFEWSQIEKRTTLTPPHATRCRERAVAATQHPALRLPPLPNLEDGAQLAAAAAKAIASGSGGEAASAQRAPVVPATPAAASVTAPRALTEDWGANDMAEDDDIGDYV